MQAYTRVDTGRPERPPKPRHYEQLDRRISGSGNFACVLGGHSGQGAEAHLVDIGGWWLYKAFCGTHSSEALNFVQLTARRKGLANTEALEYAARITVVPLTAEGGQRFGSTGAGTAGSNGADGEPESGPKGGPGGEPETHPAELLEPLWEHPRLAVIRDIARASRISPAVGLARVLWYLGAHHPEGRCLPGAAASPPSPLAMYCAVAGPSGRVLAATSGPTSRERICTSSGHTLSQQRCIRCCPQLPPSVLGRTACRSSATHQAARSQ